MNGMYWLPHLKPASQSLVDNEEDNPRFNIVGYSICNVGMAKVFLTVTHIEGVITTKIGFAHAPNRRHWPGKQRL